METQPLPLSERLTLGVDETCVKDSSLHLLEDRPPMFLVRSDLESINRLNFIDTYNPHWIEAIRNLSKEERQKYIKDLSCKEVDWLLKKVNGRITELKKKGEVPERLSEEDVAVILLCTYENTSDYVAPIYKIIKEALVAKYVDVLENVGPCIINLLSALRKLGPYEGGGHPYTKG